ncbi:MAG: FGGY-family carbohydrate kinase [Elusimicrobia bacterium]|nr:FGGY-family carbohydrate kinase [Elusimicrobiota bacterium]
MSKNVYSLGIEFSTQSVKIVILDVNEGDIIYTSKFDYDNAFPKYKTVGGVLASPVPETNHTSPLMLIEALDYSFKNIIKNRIRLSEIHIIKIDAMQHCTIYTNHFFKDRIKSLNPEKELTEQIQFTLSRNTVPIWEDRSPVEETKILTEMFKGRRGISYITGNKAELRFPAAQIIKWAKKFPKEYNETTNIFLLSAFITSILAGKIVPVDTGDGWGTNLNNININKPQWSKQVLQEINLYLNKLGLSTSLEEKIGNITHYDTKVGKISSYFVKKYGVNSKAIILAGTGDNPATLSGSGGNIVVSLGSSYTVNGIMKKIKYSLNGEYNIFGYTKGTAMALSCITNGGKVHNHFLKKYIIKSLDTGIRDSVWKEYIKKAGRPVLSKQEKLMLPYLMSESVPLCKQGIIRDGFNEDYPETNIRALHISQILSLRLHSTHLNKVNSICIVGGGSRNTFLRQLISDIFNADSYTIKNSNYAAPIGCAISGAKVLLRTSYKKSTDIFVQKDKSTFLKPIKENAPNIEILLKRYAKLEQNHTAKLPV